MRRASRRSYRISPHSHSHTVQNVLDTSTRTIQTPGIDGRAWSHTHILVQYTRSSLLVSSLSSEARTGRTGLLSSGVMSEGGVTVMSVLSRVPFLSDYLLCRLFSRCAVHYHRTPIDTVRCTQGLERRGPSGSCSHSPRLVFLRWARTQGRTAPTIGRAAHASSAPSSTHPPPVPRRSIDRSWSVHAPSGTSGRAFGGRRGG